MDNVIIKKIYEDNDLIEIELVANNDFAMARQSCYVNKEILDDISKKIFEYSKAYDNNCYIETGNKNGKYTPSFSMEFMKPDVHGHILIEMDVEISDNDERKHRSKFYVKTELGLVEKFATNLINIVKCNIGDEIYLND